MKKVLLISILATTLLLASAAFYLNQPIHSFAMDVNPSIEVISNRLDRVTAVNPLNEDAQKLLDGYEIKDSKLNAVVNDLVDRLILKGYLSDDKENSMVITVKDNLSDQKVVDKVNLAIAAYLDNKRIEATLVTQFIDDDQKLTSGKTVMVENLVLKNTNISREALLDMTINELIAYANANNISIDTAIKETKMVVSAVDAVTSPSTTQPATQATTEPTTKATEKTTDAITSASTTESSTKNVTSGDIISGEKAKSIALGLVNGEIIKFELEDDDDDLVYEIKIKANGILYEIEINAYTGAVYEFERENDDRDDDEDEDHDDDDDDDDDDDHDDDDDN